jgi:DNA-binding NarL/FixJ family response regulator
MSEVRVLIVEDEPLIAEDISDFLGETNYICAGIAYDSETALDMLINRDPDIALLDINIEGSMNGIDIAQVIRNKHNIPFIFLTSHSDKETLDKAKLTLPYGYIVKPFNENDLISSLEMAVFRHANENKSNIPTLAHINSRLTSSLTEKEYDCLVQLSNGLTNKQMAEIQFLSINTIKTHLKNLFLKLDVPNRTKAINKAFRL